MCVLGGSDLDIATEFSYSKPPGCGMVGNVKVPIEVEGKEITYSFYRPTLKALKFELLNMIFSCIKILLLMKTFNLLNK